MIKVSISGNVVADAEARYSAKGDMVLSFRVAVNNREQNADKEWVDVTYWYRVVTMPKSDYLSRAVIKGAKVLVVGTQKANAYIPHNGSDPRIGFDIAFPDVIEVFGKANVNQAETDDAAPASRTPAPAAAAAPDSDLEDLPF